MPDLVNLLPFKRGTKVSINGTIYTIDQNGVCAGVKDADAAELLRSPDTWRPLVKRAPAAATPPPVETAPVPPKEPIGDDEKTPAVSSAGEHVVAPSEETQVVEPTPEEVAEVTQPAEGEQEKPDAGEWPEPTEDMDISYLKQMADAYGVKYKGGTSAKRLVVLIKQAMYGDEKGA